MRNPATTRKAGPTAAQKPEGTKTLKWSEAHEPLGASIKPQSKLFGGAEATKSRAATQTVSVSPCVSSELLALKAAKGGAWRETVEPIEDPKPTAPSRDAKTMRKWRRLTRRAKVVHKLRQKRHDQEALPPQERKLPTGLKWAGQVIWDVGSLSDRAMALAALAICAHSWNGHEGGACGAPIKQLARTAGLCESTMKAALARMAKAGVLQTKRGNGQPALRWLHDLAPVPTHKFAASGKALFALRAMADCTDLRHGDRLHVVIRASQLGTVKQLPLSQLDVGTLLRAPNDNPKNAERQAQRSTARLLDAGLLEEITDRRKNRKTYRLAAQLVKPDKSELSKPDKGELSKPDKISPSLNMSNHGETHPASSEVQLTRLASPPASTRRQNRTEPNHPAQTEAHFAVGGDSEENSMTLPPNEALKNAYGQNRKSFFIKKVPINQIKRQFRKIFLK